MAGQKTISSTYQEPITPSFVVDCHITGTVSPDIIGNGTIAGTYNGKFYRNFPVLGWQVLNKIGTPDIPPGTSGRLIENIEYDPVTNKYWWVMHDLNQPAYYCNLAYADTITGPWTILETGISQGAVPHLKKFGNVWYLYFSYGGDIYVSTSFTVVGPYSTPGILVLSKGNPGQWDAGLIGECFVFEYNGGYAMLYMGQDLPAGEPTGLEKVGLATCATPNGTFIKSPNNPIISGNSEPGHWNSGYDRAADPYAFQLDPASGIWYIGVTACVTNKSSWTVGFYQTTDFINFSEVSISNPFIIHGILLDAWDHASVLRGAAIKVGNQWYLPYTGQSSYTGLFAGGLATFNLTGSNYLLWWNGVNAWYISLVKGTPGPAYWIRYNPSHLGNYAPQGTAKGTATVSAGPG